jgi:hypothetical protein
LIHLYQYICLCFFVVCIYILSRRKNYIALQKCRLHPNLTLAGFEPMIFSSRGACVATRPGSLVLLQFPIFHFSFFHRRISQIFFQKILTATKRKFASDILLSTLDCSLASPDVPPHPNDYISSGTDVMI